MILAYYPTIRAKKKDRHVGQQATDYDHVIHVRAWHLDVSEIIGEKINGDCFAVTVMSFSMFTTGIHDVVYSSLFPSCAATRVMNIKITLEWA